MIPGLGRSTFPIAAMAVAMLACSLGAGGITEPPPTQPGGGGLPMSKSTPTRSSKGSPPTKAAPEPTTPPEPTQAPSGAPTQAGTVELPVSITNLNVVSPNEAPKVIGLVQNTSATDLKSLRLTLNFIDASGNVAETRQGTTWMVTLPAGEITPFDFFFPQGVPLTTDSVVVAVEWEEADEVFQRFWTRDGFDLQNVNGEWGDYYYTITGSVANSSGRGAKTVFLSALAYNPNGRLVGISSQYIENLDPGAVKPFEIRMAPSSMAEETLDRFEVLVEASLEE